MVPQYGSSPPPSTPPPFKPMSDCSPSSSRDSEDSEAGSAYTINSSSEGSDADGEFELDDGYESEFAILAFATLLLKPTLDVGKIDAQFNHISNLASRCLNAQAYIIDLDNAFSMLLTHSLRAAACNTWASKSADLTATFYEHVFHKDRSPDH
ncbi:unnamed protein product [Tilletia caries]|nr:unnamed protein product [Tilletia caries]